VGRKGLACKGFYLAMVWRSFTRSALSWCKWTESLSCLLRGWLALAAAFLSPVCRPRPRRVQFSYFFHATAITGQELFQVVHNGRREPNFRNLSSQHRKSSF
jgi:hypothetical protein